MGLFFFSLVSGSVFLSSTIISNLDENPVTDAIINTPSLTSSEVNCVLGEMGKEVFSKEDICRIMKGCWDGHECYPNGYRINDKYCSLIIKTGYTIKKFVNQFDAGENCINSFECKSNFCFNGECIDIIKTDEEGVVRINKSDLDELRKIIEDAELSMNENYDEETSVNFFSSLISLFRKIFS